MSHDFFPSLSGESVSFCAPAPSIHLQSSYLGQSVPFLPSADPRTRLSPSQTTVSLLFLQPAMCQWKKAESDFLCRSSSCHCATHQTFQHTAWSGCISPDYCRFSSFCPSCYVSLAEAFLWISTGARLAVFVALLGTQARERKSQRCGRGGGGLCIVFGATGHVLTWAKATEAWGKGSCRGKGEEEGIRERERASTAVSSLNLTLIRNNRAGGSRGPSLDPNSL